MKTVIAAMILCISVLIVGRQPAAADYEAGVKYYQQGNYVAALEEFRADGSAQSKFYLSLMYEKGDGIPQNRKMSLAMLRMAAEEGLDVAQASLGMIYFEGLGVPADEREGIMWLRKAAAQGLAEAEQMMRVEMAQMK